MEEQALVVEAQPAARRWRPNAPPPTERLTASTNSRSEVECIVEEVPTAGAARCWYLVRWAGYHPSWEAWRIRGNVGEPVETWEPRSHVSRTAAYATWQKSKAERSRQPLSSKDHNSSDHGQRR